MHGMLSAAILIGFFAVVAAACLYLVVRVFAAAGGKHEDRPRGRPQVPAQVAAQVVAGHHDDAS